MKDTQIRGRLPRFLANLTSENQKQLVDSSYLNNPRGVNENNYFDMVANGQASLLKVYYETFLKEYVIKNR